MELIKKNLDVKDAIGWYLMTTEMRHWTEEVVNDETGESEIVERSEPLYKKGEQINEIVRSLLEENGIKTVKVSNIPLLGSQEKYLNLWETILKTRTNKGDSKKSWYVTADSPSAAEESISDYYEINIEGSFEVVKVSKLEFGKVIKLYETERDEYEEDGKKKIKWYKCQIYAIVDDDGGESDSHNAGTRNILVQATTFENAIAAIKSVINQNEYESMYNTFKTLAEINIVDVFIPDENVSYYSNLDL